MKHLHATLRRQIELYLDGQPMTTELQSFLDAVDRTYNEFDRTSAVPLNGDTPPAASDNGPRDSDPMKTAVRARQSARLQSEINERLITEVAKRKRAEQKYRSIFENSVDGIFQCSLDGRLMDANPAMAGMLGYGRVEDLLADAVDVSRFYVNADDRERYHEELRTTGRVDNFEAEFLLRDGTPAWGRINAVLLHDDQGNPIHMEGTCENISRRKEMEQALKQAKEDAEELSLLKTNLLSMVSHELRTPLTSILGYSKIIKKQFEKTLADVSAQGELAERLHSCKRIRDNLNIITLEGQRLTDLINDVLDLAKLESGGMEWHDQTIAMQEIITHALETTAVLFRQRGLKLHRDVPDTLPMIRGDRDRLIQVCINLLSNAAKFTEKGSVSCSAKVDGDMLCVSVADTGRGIEEPERETIFTKFKQLEDTLSGRPRGTGLGLAICKEIVERHGGRIWVESKPGSGSVFRFTVPLAPGE